MPLALVADMRGILVILAVAACNVGVVETLKVEPAELDLTVQLDAAIPATFRVTSDGNDVTAAATYAMTGAPLGAVTADGFHSDGRTGGRATVTVTFRGVTATLPVHVMLQASRNDAASQVPGWFASAAQEVVDSELEPGDGAVLPPNLATLDVALDPPAGDDVHDFEFLSPDLDLHVYGSGGVATLNAAEWDAVSRTSLGKPVELIARSLATATPTTSHVVSAHMAVTDLQLASTVLFAGAHAGETPQIWCYDPTRASTQVWAPGAAAADLAISRDGRRIAAGLESPTASPAASGTLLDVASRTAVVAPSSQVGLWTDAAFQPDGSLMTANAGVLTLRSAATALPVKNLTLDVMASQPTVAHNGRALAYVDGAMDTTTTPASPQPTPQELAIRAWDPATATAGASLTLVPATDGVFVKYPDFSSDDRSIVYSSVPAPTGAMGDIMVVPADATDDPFLVASGYDMARFASPIKSAHSGYSEPDQMVWIVMQSDRAIGGRDQTGVPQLWAVAYYPELGMASRPIYLPGQDAKLAVQHAPAILPH
jgi:hypothetical protein